jgi:hypothetical protein
VTRPTRLVLAVSAVLLLAAFGIAQATDYARAPLLPDPAVDMEAEVVQVARATGCGDLRLRYTVEHSVWKGGVRDGHDAEVEPQLELMRHILRRIQALSEQGRCGG